MHLAPGSWEGVGLLSLAPSWLATWMREPLPPTEEAQALAWLQS